MRFDVPVIAFKSTGMPYAMNGAGILVRQKRYDVIGELIDVVVRDATLRQSIIQRQRARLAELSPERVATQLRELIPRLVQLADARTAQVVLQDH
jgi:glycosyltransferase involved in cell wall biosynthesis